VARKNEKGEGMIRLNFSPYWSSLLGGSATQKGGMLTAKPRGFLRL